MRNVTKLFTRKITGSVIVLTLLLSSCASVEEAEKPPLKKYANAVDPASRNVAIASSDKKRVSGAIEQISVSDITAAQQQLETDIDEDESIAQLREYVDQCAPDVETPVDVDCSQMKLRVKEQYRNDDELIEALSTIDRLTKSADAVADDLDRGGDSLSAEAQAIAGGLLSPDSDPQPQEEQPEDLPAEAEVIKAVIIETLGG